MQGGRGERAAVLVVACGQGIGNREQDVVGAALGCRNTMPTSVYLTVDGYDERSRRRIFPPQLTVEGGGDRWAPLFLTLIGLS